MSQSVCITHKLTGLLLAEGPLGWGITSFEGNYYISRKYLRTSRFTTNFVPGLCPYKFLYVWLDLTLDDGGKEKNLGWMYWLPNPLFPFIWFRVALPGSHPALLVERYQVRRRQSLFMNPVRPSHSGEELNLNYGENAGRSFYVHHKERKEKYR